MGAPTFDDHINSMTAPSDARLAAVGETLKGVGPQALREFEQLRDVTSAMPRLGREGADGATKLRGDTSLPYDHRTRGAEDRLAFHKAAIQKHYEFAVAGSGRLEAELMVGLLPKPVKDEQRSLVQHEVELVLGGASGQELVRRAIAALGKDPRHDAELLSSYGHSLFRGQGVEDSFGSLKAQAVTKYLALDGGTDKQQASRKALVAFRAANMAGSVASYRAAGLLALARDDR